MKRNILMITAALVVVMAPAAMAQTDLGLKGVGAAIGFVSPEHLDGTFSFGALADLGTLAPNIKLEPRLDYWSWSKSDMGVDSKAHDVALGARGKYFFEMKNSSLHPFAGAGLAFHFVGSEVSTPAGGGLPAMTVNDSETKLGLDLGGGLSTPITPRADLLSEVWYGFVSDVNQFSLRVGVSYKLGS